MTYARSRSRIGARPRITRYARNNADTKALSNPLLQLPLYSGFWGDDPAWTDNPGVGQAVSSWRNGGTLAASGAYTDPTLGLVLPGVAGNYASTPDAAALDITGDITLVARVALDDWTPAVAAGLISKWESDPNRSFTFYVNATTGVLVLSVSPTGNFADRVSYVSSVAPTVSDGGTLWVAVSLDVDNGAANSVAKFWTSSDGVTWAQLGSDRTAAVTSVTAGSSACLFGQVAGSTLLDGAFSVARVYSGSGFTTAGPSGTLVLDVDFRRTSVGAFTCSTGQTVTVASTFNALQATAGSRPTLTTSALLGGRRVVDFDGTDDRLEITSGVSLAQPFEVWAITVLDVVNTTKAILGMQSASINNRIGPNAGSVWASRYGSSGLAASGGTASTATPYLTRWLADGASGAIFANGVSQATGGSATDAMDQIIIGAGRTAPSTYGNHYDGRIAFLGILPAASITATHRRAFALWAASFYSVPGFAAAA